MTEGSASIRHRRADIQGLRAVAVAGVVANHLFGWPHGGFLGVDVFFVVSGFVITGVLLRERDRSGGTSLRGFYARRARRILPLALVVLVATLLMARWAFAPPKVDGVRSDALWASMFAANWHFAQQGADYFQLGQAPSPLQHYWSLGVEEQFYLVWPWLFTLVMVGLGARSARRGRAGMAVVMVLLAAGSLTWAAVQTRADPTTAYYSSLTRAWELALGAALATLPSYAVRLPALVRSALSWAGITGVVVAFLLVGTSVGVPFPAAVFPAAATLFVLLAGVGVPARGAVLLTNPVSRYLGDISYGVYLWHFPLIAFVATVLMPGSVGERVTVLGGTVVLATISYHLIERPILDAPRWRASADSSARREAWRVWWAARRRGIVTAGAAVACLVAGVAGTAAADPEAFAPSSSLVLAADTGAVPAPPAPTSAPTAPTTATPAPTPTAAMTPSAAAPSTARATVTVIPLGATGQAVQDGLRGALNARSWPSHLDPPTDPWHTTARDLPALSACAATKASDPRSCTFGNRNGPEIVVYGDSLGLPLLATVVAAYGKDYKIRGMTKIACAVNGVDANFGKDDWAIPCVNHRRMTIDYVRKSKPDVLMMIETYAWSTKLKSHASGAAAAAEWHSANQAFVNAIKGSVKHIVIVSPSIPGVAFGDCYRAGGSPARCLTGIPSWWRVAHDAERHVVGATFIDTLHWYCVDGRCPIFTRINNTVLKSDYLHPSVQYARVLVADLAYRLAFAGVLPAR